MAAGLPQRLMGSYLRKIVTEFERLAEPLSEVAKMSTSVSKIRGVSESAGEVAKMSASIFAHMISGTSRTAKIKAWPNA
jgi:hypothetical protein